MMKPATIIASVMMLPLTASAQSASVPMNCCGASNGELSPDDQRDATYRALIRDFGRFRAIWKQQPENRNALKIEVAQLVEHVTTLKRGITGTGDETEPPDEGNQSEPNEVGPPQGPLRPSQVAPSEEDIERFMSALEGTHLPGPVDRRDRDISLREVPVEWVADVCDVAEHELLRLSLLAAAEQHDVAAIEAAIKRIGTLVERIGRPADIELERSNTEPLDPGR